MSVLKILIIGGYGTFGGHIARLLANEPSLRLFIAGRSADRAKAFVDEQKTGNLEPIVFDRDHEPAAQIRDLSPNIVIDASGPFQRYGIHRYRIATAAIENGAHYIDLADGTDFVAEIGELDANAKAKGVYVLAGASTCPVLTTAVARKLSGGLTRIDSIAGGIAPSPFAGMGKSVVRAIADYAGKPVKRFIDGELSVDQTFTSTHQFTIAPPGVTPLQPMKFSLIDVPDLTILANVPGPVSSTWFGVATTPAIYHRLLRILARLVGLRIIPTLRPLAGLMHFVMNQLAWGEHRGGMFVEVCGTDASGAALRRSWHLIAEGIKGPTVPALAAVAIVRRHLLGVKPAPGARSADGALNLDDYNNLFMEIGINTGEREQIGDNVSSVFEDVLGSTWRDLPTPLKALHASAESQTFTGVANIARSTNIVASFIGWAAGFPAAGKNVPTTVKIERQSDHEIWHRNFDGQEFSSVMSVGDDRFSRLICEQIGPTKMGMALVQDGDHLRYIARRWSFLGIPLPRKFAPMGDVYETTNGDQFVFHVEIRVPIVGHVVTYHGELDVTQAR